MAVTVVSRSDESNTTAVLQGYLAAEGGWTGDTSTTFAGRSSQAVQGEAGMLATIENTDAAYPLVSVGHALAGAGAPAVRDFLLASLNAQRDETGYLFPTGEWADRLVALLQ